MRSAKLFFLSLLASMTILLVSETSQACFMGCWISDRVSSVGQPVERVVNVVKDEVLKVVETFVEGVVDPLSEHFAHWASSLGIGPCRDSNADGIRTSCFSEGENAKIAESFRLLSKNPFPLVFRGQEISPYHYTRANTNRIVNYNSDWQRAFNPQAIRCASSDIWACYKGGTTFITHGLSQDPTILSAVLLHESAHNVGGHTCGGGADSDLDGSYGVEAMYLMSNTFDSNLSEGEKALARGEAAGIANNRMCDRADLRDAILNYIPASARGAIVGNIDSVSIENIDMVIRGWACSVGDTSPINVHIYYGGAYGTGTMITASIANYDTGVHSECATNSRTHGFIVSLTEDQWRAASGQTIWVHGISPSGDGMKNLTIRNSGSFAVPVANIAAVRCDVPSGFIAMCNYGADIRGIDTQPGLKVYGAGDKVPAEQNCVAIVANDANNLYREVRCQADGNWSVTGQWAPPRISNAGTGCDDGYCIWITGMRFMSDSYVDFRHGQTNELLFSLHSSQLQIGRNNTTGEDLITLTLSDPRQKAYLNATSLNVYVVNPSRSNWSNNFVVQRSQSN